MKVLRNLIYREVIQAVLYVSLAFLALFFFFDLVDEMRWVGSGNAGYTATRALRSSREPRGATVPIVAMTANAFREDVERALASGMNGHVSKPIDEEKLHGELGKYLG